MSWFSAPTDAVGCVAFQPLHSNLLSASGSRHFDRVITEGDSDDSDSEHPADQNSDSDSDSESQNVITMSRRRPHPYVKDSSLKLWSFKTTRCGLDATLDWVSFCGARIMFVYITYVPSLLNACALVLTHTNKLQVKLATPVSYSQKYFKEERTSSRAPKCFTDGDTSGQNKDARIHTLLRNDRIPLNIWRGVESYQRVDCAWLRLIIFCRPVTSTRSTGHAAWCFEAAVSLTLSIRGGKYLSGESKVFLRFEMFRHCLPRIS
jgi:hypothetical protein